MPVDLGELLLKEKMITPQQLQEVLNHQKLSGGSLRRALVGLGFVKDENITGLLGRRYGVPSVDLVDLEIDPAVIKVIPAETARKHQVLPVSRVEKTLKLAMADPANVVAIDDVGFMTGYKVEPAVASEVALEEAIHRYYGVPRAPGTRMEVAPTGGTALTGVVEEPTLTPDDLAAIGGLSDIDLDALETMYGGGEEDQDVDLGGLARSADAAPVVKLVNVLFVDSLKRGASDIHIEPYEKEFRVRFRIDGVLHNVMALPLKLRDPLTSRIKVMAKLDIAEKRFPQDGRIKIKMKVEDRSRDLDFRVCVRPTLWGETIVMRLLDKSKLMLDMTKLGFEAQSLERFKNAISRTYGMVLVTGPERSGKTNTLYSAIAALNKPDVHIITAEDRVDFSLPGINQVQINEQIGESFATVLRSFRLIDADIILVGKMRDRETAEIAVEAALSGHLVLSTLHTNDAPSTVSRLVNMGINPFLVGTTVNLIQAQRLVRRICSECKVDVTTEVPSKVLIDTGFAPEHVGTFPIYRGRGCRACIGTGYKGRVGLYEVMEISDRIRDLVMVGATAAEIRTKALEEGMISLRMSGLEKVKQGITTIEEVLRETVRGE
jgi:type IV pilus assembly protein PilB